MRAERGGPDERPPRARREFADRPSRARREFADRPPWARQRHVGWPPGAVVGALLFHVLGVRNVEVHTDLLVLVYALLLIGPLALFWRRRAPLVVFAVAASASIALATIASPHWTYLVAPLIALFCVSGAGRHRTAFVAAGVAFAAYLAVMFALLEPLGLPGDPPGLRQALLLAAGLGGAVVTGVAGRGHAEQAAAVARFRAEQERAEEEQARARAEQERRQASEERLRIASELHDVLGHHLSLINVQAGVGLHLMDSRPEQAREALAAIKTASSEALREVRSVLDALRTEGEAAPRQPALGLNRLGELTADAGIPVRTTIMGEPRELPAEVDRAAYRIVQEALTNVRRHAGPKPDAVVSIGYLPSYLHLSIKNDGPVVRASEGEAVNSGGHGSGIAGMRARAESLGGRLEAGPPSAGGFLVSVMLPAPGVYPEFDVPPSPDGPFHPASGTDAEAEAR
ncbi:sensor histidine kinase [Actinoplanes sp. NPDC023936]|uniref:sensor histidine kinase n=1 Tax=Actinoplanes sp. NPDC023936 TaxID=3154910 RepID=UPI0033FC987D